MQLRQINPHIRYALEHGILHQRPGWSICYDCRLFYMKQGSATLVTERGEYDISQNTAVFLPPRTRYRFRLPRQKQTLGILVFNFDLVCDYAGLEISLGTADEATFLPDKVPAYDLPEQFGRELVGIFPGLARRLDSCAELFLRKPDYYRETAGAILKWCLLELLRERPDGSVPPVVRQVSDYIHAHYSEPGLTNRNIADRFGYHPYYISQLMKRVTGQSLHSCLIAYRIRMARYQLITTELDIATVSWKCGFQSCAYFIKQFRLHTGLTPGQYRRQHTDQAL